MNKKLSDLEFVFFPLIIILSIWYHTGSLAYGIGAGVLGFVINAAITSVKATRNMDLDPKNNQLLHHIDNIPPSFVRRAFFLSYLISGCIMIFIDVFF